MADAPTPAALRSFMEWRGVSMQLILSLTTNAAFRAASNGRAPSMLQPVYRPDGSLFIFTPTTESQANLLMASPRVSRTLHSWTSRTTGFMSLQAMIRQSCSSVGWAPSLWQLTEW